MQEERLNELTQDQLWAMVIAYDVRNALEKFHAYPDGYGLIPDSLMPELNQTVLRRVHHIVYALLNYDRRHPGCLKAVNWAFQGVPSYWEVPEMLPEEREYMDRGYSAEQWEKLTAATEPRRREENERWQAQALTAKEKELVDWFKATFIEQGAVKPEALVGKMKEMEFLNASEEDWEHLAWFGNIYQRAGLGNWLASQQKKGS